jgi:protein-S-isoprenylcysteine O-methyltransferase Ste14
MEPNLISADDRAARANSFPWPPVLFIAAVGAAWAMGRVVPISWPGTDDLAARLVGRGFGVAGLVLIVWSFVSLTRAHTTVMPDGVSEALVTTGPYARFRNPIYLGETLLLLAGAEVTKNVWFAAAAAAFVMLVTRLQILPEERHLTARFGGAYDAYRSRTRRWI